MSLNRITSSQEIVEALQPVPNFKSKKEIKTWIHDCLDGRGINLVIERSDSSKAVFKCKNLHRKQNTPRPSVHDAESATGKKKLRSVPEESCPFRLRISYSVKNKSWSVNIINDEHNPALCSNFGNHNGGSAFPTPNSAISTPNGVTACNSLNRKRHLSSVYNTPVHLQSPRDSPLASMAYGTPDYNHDNKRARMSSIEENEEPNTFQFQSRSNSKPFQGHSQLTNVQRSFSTSPQPPFQLCSQSHTLPSQGAATAAAEEETTLTSSFVTDFQIPEELNFANDNSLLLNHRRTSTLSESFDELQNIHIHASENKLLDSFDFELDHFAAQPYQSPTTSIPISPSTNLPLAPFALKSQSSSPTEWRSENQVEVLFDQDSILEFFNNPGNYEENYLMNDPTASTNNNSSSSIFDDSELLFLQSHHKQSPINVKQTPKSTSKTTPSGTTSSSSSSTSSSTSTSTSRYRNIQPAPAKPSSSSYQPIQPIPTLSRNLSSIAPVVTLVNEINDDFQSATGFQLVNEFDDLNNVGFNIDEVVLGSGSGSATTAGLFDGFLSL
ncbi:hypothetical protein WICPIJ_002842 [Wickerhamomyces pijperi]|uniref:Uncharacterized protein n=1 Tax=Wickerhamomyces pijperi TaxID=599730 RepID=A0A9P8QB19_WICPI|nr:hypothetical protein WICPIJ_002842 [Wickerhamomyces pijperi]